MHRALMPMPTARGDTAGEHVCEDGWNAADWLRKEAVMSQRHDSSLNAAVDAALQAEPVKKAVRTIQDAGLTIQEAGSQGLQRLKDIDGEKKTSAASIAVTTLLVVLSGFAWYLIIKWAVSSALRAHHDEVVEQQHHPEHGEWHDDDDHDDDEENEDA